MCYREVVSETNLTDILYTGGRAWTPVYISDCPVFIRSTPLGVFFLPCSDGLADPQSPEARGNGTRVGQTGIEKRETSRDR